MEEKMAELTKESKLTAGYVLDRLMLMAESISAPESVRVRSLELLGKHLRLFGDTPPDQEFQTCYGYEQYIRELAAQRKTKKMSDNSDTTSEKPESSHGDGLK
jgi:hypothetical protein